MKNILSNIKVSLITIVVTLLLGEGAFRVYSSFVMNYDVEMHKYALKLKQKSSVDGLTHEHIPGESADLMGVVVKLNEFGFRDELTPEYKSNKRVQVIGSSITMGWGVPYDSVFTSKLDKEYNSKGIEFINTGIGNYNTVLEEKAFYENYKTIQPSEVWLHYYVNDAETVSSKANNPILKYSYLAAFSYIKYKQLQFTQSESVSSIGEYYWNMYDGQSKGWKEAKESILRMKSFCEDRNVSFKVLIQPDLHDFSEKSYQSKVHLKIRRFLDSNGLVYKDLFQEFKLGLEKYQAEGIWVNPDDSHPNQVGHHIIFEGAKDLMLR